MLVLQKEALAEIFASLPAQSLAHLKTSAGDKICVKDNQITSANKISANPKEYFLEIVVTQQKNGKEHTSYTYIDYDDILRVEVMLTNKDEKNAS